MLGAGMQWHEAYATVNSYGRLMVGGASAGGSVSSSGGWLAGGGHSALSPTHGLGKIPRIILFSKLIESLKVSTML